MTDSVIASAPLLDPARGELGPGASVRTEDDRVDEVTEGDAALARPADVEVIDARAQERRRWWPEWRAAWNTPARFVRPPVPRAQCGSGRSHAWSHQHATHRRRSGRSSEMGATVSPARMTSTQPMHVSARPT